MNNFTAQHEKKLQGYDTVVSYCHKLFFVQSCNDGFYNCLHVWTEFLDYVAQKMEDRTCVKGNYLARYFMPRLFISECDFQLIKMSIYGELQYRFDKIVYEKAVKSKFI